MDEQEFAAVKSAIVNRAVAEALRESRRRRAWMAAQAAKAHAFRAALAAEGATCSSGFTPGPVATKVVIVRERP